MVRTKYETADLKRRYPRVLRRCMAITALLMVLSVVLLPTLSVRSDGVKKTLEEITLIEIPETHQKKQPPPPPRPAVPIETESDDVPDDVTIATTELDFDVPVTVPDLPSQDTTAVIEEEILEFWAVEEKPEMTHYIQPAFPEMARRAGLQGQVIVSFTVTADGNVMDPKVMRGPEIFREPALEAVRQFRFRPARQNDKPVSVRMTVPLSFKLH